MNLTGKLRGYVKDKLALEDLCLPSFRSISTRWLTFSGYLPCVRSR